MRLIDADALLVGIEEYWDVAHIQCLTRETEAARLLWQGKHGGVNYCRNLVLEAHTIDAVEVVRCKDCKHLMFSDFYGECSACHMGIVKPDDFCSFGERKK